VEDLITALDQAVAQVVIEVVIAEVNLKGDLEVGMDVFKQVFKEGQAISGGGTDNLPDLAPKDLTSEALDVATDLASGGLTYYFTLKNMRLDGVIRLLSSSSKFKVLSTPILQTQHNQEADIIVGESRPVVTSTVSDIASTAATAVRSNVEFRDIAIELKVTPRINPDGYVTMEVEQKINDVGGNVVVNGIDVPIITKREARATVAVRDESTIVLGGLIREDRDLTETKTPILGDIPFFGALFKSKGSSKNRTELIVFIRPKVLRSDEDAYAEAVRRSKLLKAGEELELEKIFDGKATETEDEFTIEEMQRERKEEAEKKQ
jgi:general secretion pathway protein D